MSNKSAVDTVLEGWATGAVLMAFALPIALVIAAMFIAIDEKIFEPIRLREKQEATTLLNNLKANASRRNLTDSVAWYDHQLMDVRCQWISGSDELAKLKR